MLQAFRSFINSIIGKIFFAILIGTFGLLGVGYGIRDLVLSATTPNDAATVNGVKISLNALGQEYRRRMVETERQMGPAFAPTAQEKQEVARDTLDEQIMNTLIAQAAHEAGFLVGDPLIRNVIESQKDFAGLGNRFDVNRFRMMLQQEGLSEATWVPMVRARMASQLLLNPIADSVTPPKALVDDMYRFRNEQRVAETVTILNDAATGIAKPSDADLDTYYKKHEAAFTAPEYRSFTVLPVTPDLFIADIMPTDDQIQDAYNAHKAEYIAPEKRKVTQVVVADQVTADAIAKAARSGKSLADAAKGATGGKAEAIGLDFHTKAETPEPLRDVVFATPKDGIAGPVKGVLGWHVVQVNDIEAGHEIPLGSVRAKLIDQVKHEEAINRLAERIDKLGDKLTGGVPMAQVAAEVNATPVKIDKVDAKGMPADAGKDAKAPAAQPDPNWVATAFGLQQNETSSFEEDKRGGYFAVRLDSVTPPTLRPLAEVRDKVIADWTREQQAVATAKLAEALAAKARAGTPMAQIATEAGAKLETSQPMTRESAHSTDSAAPSPLLVDALFRLAKIGDVTSVETENGQMVARLSEIRPADPAKAGSKLDPVTKDLTSAMQSDTLAEYRAGLRNSAKLKINPQAVEIVAGQQ
jgi:peptidyl-prolyl cis-trans isomerase D